MKDIIFKYDQEQKCFDIDLDIKVGESLETTIGMLLFSDARCEDYELPKTEISKRGFWADSLDKQTTGSKLWLLSRANKTSKTLNDAKAFCEQALESLVKEGLIKSSEVNVHFEKNAMIIKITVQNSQGNETLFFNFGD
jgi:phage gp46-like protein